MLLGLSKIIDCPGASIDFSTSVDLSDLLYGTSYPVSEPVLASGTVRNTAGAKHRRCAGNDRGDQHLSARRL